MYAQTELILSSPFLHESRRCLVFALAMVELPEVWEPMVLLAVSRPIPGVSGGEIKFPVIGDHREAQVNH